MRLVDSPALVTAGKVLGLAGVGDPNTYFDDGNLQQVLDVGPLIRRGRTFAASEGIFTGELANTHVAAATVDAGVNLYTVNPTSGGFPSPLAEGFDVWLLGSTLVHTSGDALVSGELVVSYPDNKTAFGTPAVMLHLVRSLHIATLGTLAIADRTYFRSIGDGLIGQEHPVRIPRNASVRWRTTGAGAVGAVYTAHMLFGVFPAGFGQDVIA